MPTGEAGVSVYGANDDITIKFGGFSASPLKANPRLGGSQAKVVAVKTNIQQEGLGQVTQFNELVEGENATVVQNFTIGETEEVRFNPSEDANGAGDYVFLVVNQDGMPITNGTVADFEDFSRTRAVGIAMATVQDTGSTVERPDRPEYRLGETIEFEANANFQDENIQQVALLYEESDLGNQEIDLVANNVSELSVDDISTETTFTAVEGPRRIDDNVSILGRELSERDDGPGTVMTPGDVLDFVSGEVGGDLNNTPTGDDVLNISMVAKSDTGPETTFELETQGNFSEGNYSIIHIAQGNETGQLSTTKVDGISLQEEIDPYVTSDIDEAASDTTVQPGGEFTVEADVKNFGYSSTSESFELSADGNLIINTSAEKPKIKNIDFGARESQSINFSVNTKNAAISTGRFSSEPFELGEDYNISAVPTQNPGEADSITLTVTDEEPANFSVDIDESASDTEVGQNGDLTVVSNVTNVGNLSGTK
ncbi:hypothetical protein [Halorubrum californiense]|uniref:hypothetical protein n=1 Tax=Halorubrum californiense TaxID=416585 RepID=UPI0012688B8F|nr:hypothetical protein [Halorubrum californiense]